MKSLPPFTPFSTGLSNLDLRTKRTGLLALFVFVALLSTVTFSATSIGLVRGFLFGKSSGAAKRLETNSSSAVRDSVSLPSAVATDGALNVARKGHTATVLSDGRVLIVGGENQNGFATETEILDPATGNFSVSGNLNTPRANHTATRMADGRVLIAGGRGDVGSLKSIEIFDPTSGAFAGGPNLNTARSGHSATALADGRIVFAGGDAAGSVEIHDVIAGTSANASAMNSERSMHGAALMLDGRVLFVGGRDAEGNSLTSGEVFDPANGSCSSVESVLTVARVRPHLRVLFDGKLQVIGGGDDGSMEIYDPQAGAFGAYAHVQPQGDTCANLPAQVQGSQTRAALFHNGQADVTFDRTDHTMNELTDQAIVIGGSNSNGDSVNSAPRFKSTAAEISTDKLDYSPGETVSITGRGFAPGETVRIKVHEDPHTPLERGMDVVADADGDFVGEYLVQDYDLDMRFLVGARGLTSGRTAQTTFTDTDPVAQALPYSQDFAALPHSGAGSSTYPAGWQGWSVGSVSSSSFRTNAPLADVSLSTNSHAGTTTGGVLNYNGKIGILASGSIDSSLALAINTTGYTSITVNFDIMTIRNPHDGSGNTRINQADLQYRVGTTGSFTSVSGLANGIYENNTTSQTTTGVVTGQKVESKNLTLPVAANNQSVVQLRWVQRDSSGAGSRPSFAVDNINVTGAAACAAPTSATLLPASQTLGVGDTLTLNATVTSGTAPYNFVYKQGSTTVATHNNINSTTDSYTKTNIATTDAGNYTFEVTSSGCTGSGTATSGAASVTVNKRTASIAVSFLANQITYGGNTTVTATVTDTDTGTLITPTGTVTFSSDSGESLSSTTCSLVESVTGTASCSVTVNPTQASVHNMSAAWPGDSAHNAPPNGSAGLIVNPKPVTANITVSNKTYDGNTAATITACTLSGVVSPDGVSEVDCSFGSASANFVDANAGTGKTVNASGLTLTGTKAASYSFGGSASTTADIGKANANCTITPYNVVYDTLPHTATGSCPGVDAGGAALGGVLNLAGTTHTNAGTYNDLWTFSGGTNYNYQSGYITDIITTRDGLGRYIGQQEWVTSGTSATTAQVTLTASVQDPSGLGLVGVTVDFLDMSNNKVLAAGVPVSPLAGSLSNTGIANKVVTLSTGQYGAESYVILVKLSLNYDNSDQAIAEKTATVVVSKPAATNEAIGAGSIAYLSTSAGTYRSDIGATAIYTVGMEYNKSGTNPQGKVTVQIPRSDGIIVVKSNSISSMQLVSKTNPRKMTIYTKSAISRVDNLGNVTTIEGNVTLRMDIEDYNTGGALADKVGFTVLSSKDSTLFYSNNWVLVNNAWRTAVQNLLTGCVSVGGSGS